MLAETTTPFRRRALIAAAIGFVFALVVWNIPQLGFILYPVRLFVTFVHEAGHGLAAVLTGGQIHGLEVFPSGAGIATTSGGLRWVILPAGYLGAALFGALLFVAANRLHHPRVIAGALAAAVGFIAVAYTGFFSTAFLVGLGMAAALGVLAWRAHDDLILIVLNWLAVVCALNAVFDLFSLIGNSDAGLGGVRNDAAAFSALYAPFIPAAVWALLWAAIALVLMAWAVWVGVVAPHRRRPG
jgi:hypothetical protein